MRRRWHWGIGITLVYVAFASTTVGFVAFAMRQQIDLVSADYYPQSLTYDARMAASARAEALGDTFSIAADTGSERLIVTWPTGMLVEAGRITLYRASDADADRQFTAAPDERGRQYVGVRALPRGAWIVRVEWTAGGHEFFAEERVMLP